jgi:hypothetical protein
VTSGNFRLSGVFVVLKVIVLNKEQIVPRRELGEEWINLEEWWPDTVSFLGRELAGRVLMDVQAGLAIIGVVKFKTTEDTVSIRRGVEWLRSQGYEDIEMVDVSDMKTYPPKRTRKKATGPHSEGS